MHRSRLGNVVIDCQTDHLLSDAQFWSAALGYPLPRDLDAASHFIQLVTPAGDVQIIIQASPPRSASAWRYRTGTPLLPPSIVGLTTRSRSELRHCALNKTLPGVESMEPLPKGLPLQQITALLKIGFTELQYWLIGMTPETYHFQQSRNYDQLHAPSRSAHHSHEVLKYAEYPEPRARLGYHYATLGRYLEAAEHYRKAVQTWPHPSIMLALAQSELRIGNYVAAAEWLERTEKSEMKAELEQAIAEVSSEVAAVNSALQATGEDARA